MAEDADWMAAALSLARRGLGQVWPNPAVGCVIVKDGRVLGRGWTQPGGRPHAETMALAQAGDGARGATAYVSLEPCAHHGKTPPCADALIASGIARVVMPLEDPDPRVSGKGVARLHDAGISVEIGLLAAEAEAVNCGFLMRQRSGRPWVTLKLAASLDGRIATATGQSQGITGAAARARVHLLRATHDAVLVGAGTMRADDPALNVRLPGLERRTPVRIVADSGATLSKSSQLARTAIKTPVWLCHRHGIDATTVPEGVDAIPVAPLGGALDLTDMMTTFSARGLTRIFCEGGGGLAAGLLRAGLVDELVWMTAGLAIGGDGAPGLADLGIDALGTAPRFTLTRAERLGGDVMTVWHPQRQNPA